MGGSGEEMSQNGHLDEEDIFIYVRRICKVKDFSLRSK